MVEDRLSNRAALDEELRRLQRLIGADVYAELGSLQQDFVERLTICDVGTPRGGLPCHPTSRCCFRDTLKPLRTSLTGPLRIAVVSAPGIPGAIGLTLCPGKKDKAGGWTLRDLETDLTVILEWGAEIVVTLVDRHEILLLGVTDLGNAVARHGIEWIHLPIRDVSVPNYRFEAQGRTAGAELRKVIRRGGSVIGALPRRARPGRDDRGATAGRTRHGLGGGDQSGTQRAQLASHRDPRAGGACPRLLSGK